MATDETKKLMEKANFENKEKLSDYFERMTMEVMNEIDAWSYKSIPHFLFCISSPIWYS